MIRMTEIRDDQLIKTSRFQDFWNVLRLLLLSIGVMILIIIVFGMWLNYDTHHRYDHVTISDIYRITRIQFPSDSKVLHSIGDSFMRPCLWVKVEMSAKEAIPFMRGLNGIHPTDISRKRKLSESSYPQERGMRNPIEWWNPRSAKRFVSAEFTTPGSDMIAVLIDLDQPDRVIVYLSYQDG